MPDCSDPNCSMCEGPLRLAHARIKELEKAVRLAMSGQCGGCRHEQPFLGHANSHAKKGHLAERKCSAYPILRKALEYDK